MNKSTFNFHKRSLSHSKIAFYFIGDANFYPADQPSVVYGFYLIIQDGYSNCRHLICFLATWKKKGQRDHMPTPFKAFFRSCSRLPFISHCPELSCSSAWNYSFYFAQLKVGLLCPMKKGDQERTVVSVTITFGARQSQQFFWR